MSFRSYFLIFSLSLGWFGSLYPMVKLMKWTRKQQAVFLLGVCGAPTHRLQEEWRQIDLVLRFLQERAQKNNRKIRVLYEKAPALVKAACATPIPDSNRPRIDCFKVNFDDQIEALHDLHFVLQEVPIQLMAREFINILWQKNALDFEESHFDERVQQNLKSLTLNDLIAELRSQERGLADDFVNIPTEKEIERCAEQLEKASRRLQFFERDNMRWYPVDKPFNDLIKDIPDEFCIELYENMRGTSNLFFEAFIGHQIMKSDLSEDLIIIADPENIFGISQYIIGLGWSGVYTADKAHLTLLTEPEIDDILWQRSISQKIMVELHELALQTQHSMATIYQSILSYLSRR